MNFHQRFHAKLRHLTRNLIDSKDSKENIPQEFELIIDQKNSINFRIFWSFLVAICFLIYSYQMYDRISYFLDSPTAIDVYEEKIETFKFPVAYQCVLANKYVMDYYNLSAIGIDQKDSLLPLDKLIIESEVDLTKVWNLNYSFHSIQDTYKINRREHRKVKTTVNVTLIQELSPWGTCTKIIDDRILTGNQIYESFDYDLEVPELINGISVTLSSMTFPLEYQYGVCRPSIVKAYFGLRFRVHHFISTRNNPCSLIEEYIQCGKQCMEKMLNKNTCWLPYRPRYSNGQQLELCNNSEATLKMYRKNREEIVAPTPTIDCGCRRSCENTQLDGRIELIKTDNRLGTSSWYIEDDHKTILKERLLYHWISLLSDFGGNLGLWLGLSLLSVTNLIQVTFSRCKARWYKTKTTVKNDSLSVQIESYIPVCQEIIKSQTQKPTKFKINQKLSYLVYFCLIGWNGFLVQQRIFLYISEPIQTTVFIEDPDNVTFPNIITCSGIHNPRFLREKYNYLKQNKPNSTKCNMDTVDLVNWNGKVTVEKLWQLIYMKPIEPLIIQRFNPFSGDLFKVRTYTTLPSPHGICVKHSFGPIKFQLYTMFLDSTTEQTHHKCKPDYSHVYFTPPEEQNFSYKFNMLFPSSLTTTIVISRLNVHQLNTKRKQCNVNLTDYYKCKNNCLNNKIQRKQLCSMPFAVKNNVSFCNTSATAKTVRKLYYEIHTFTKIEKQCSCQPACKQPFYKFNEFSYPSFLPDESLLTVLFPTNKIEIIAEEFKYSFVALISDIGNAFGLTLGFSVLTIIHFVRTTSNSALIVLKKKF